MASCIALLLGHPGALQWILLDVALPIGFFFRLGLRESLGGVRVRNADPNEPKRGFRLRVAQLLPPFWLHVGMWLLSLGIAVSPDYLVKPEAFALGLVLLCLDMTEFMQREEPGQGSE